MSKHTPEPWAHKAPHAVTDRTKLARMIRALRRGGDLPAV